MNAIQWFAFLILPVGLAIVAIIAARLFERAHPIPANVGPTSVAPAHATPATPGFTNTSANDLTPPGTPIRQR
jgi:hypothetical protein